MKVGDKVVRVVDGKYLTVGETYKILKTHHNGNDIMVSADDTIKRWYKCEGFKATDWKRYEFSVPYEEAVRWEEIQTSTTQPLLVVEGLDNTYIGIDDSIFCKAIALGEDHKAVVAMNDILEKDYEQVYSIADGTTLLIAHTKNIKPLIKAVRAVRQGKGTRRKVTVKYVEV